MIVGLMSLFRNSASRGQLLKYFEQANALKQALESRGDRLELCPVYGDCTDDTARGLRYYAKAGGWVSFETEYNHGGPVFGSTEEPARMKALSQVINARLSTLPALDAVIYVESDLVWHSDVWVNLLGDLEPGYDVIAPLIFAGKMFYDVWGFRKLDGERFASKWPGSDGDLMEVSSVGSGFVMRGDVAKTCRIKNDYALVGFCDDVRAHGYRIWVDPTERIAHPA